MAMLRIAIALHTKHYEKILSSRRGRLLPEFQAKLGWLVGNLYSRVGTDDWSEPRDRRQQQKDIIDGILDDLTEVKWASSEAIDRAEKDGFSADGKSHDEISDLLNSFEPNSLDKRVCEELKRIVAAEDLNIPVQTQERLLKRLPNDASMAQLFRHMRKL